MLPLPGLCSSILKEGAIVEAIGVAASGVVLLAIAVEAVSRIPIGTKALPNEDITMIWATDVSVTSTIPALWILITWMMEMGPTKLMVEMLKTEQTF
jgi:hypothetical protein